MATSELKAFLYVARSDDSGAALADDESLVETLRTKSPRGFRWFSQAFPDETHGSIPLLAQIDALRHVYPGYRLHSDLLENGIAFAERHFEEVSKTVGWPLPVPEGVLNRLAYAALSGGRTQEAIAIFKRTIDENPNSANAFDSLADGFEKAGMWKEAAGAAERAVALADESGNPNRPHFTEHARKINARLRQETEAPK
jgi:tetratricopeptide (TPR) repeat protein